MQCPPPALLIERLEAHGLLHLHQVLEQKDLCDIEDAFIDKLGLCRTDQSKLRQLVSMTKQSRDRKRSEASNRRTANAKEASLEVWKKTFRSYLRKKHPAVREERLERMLEKNWEDQHRPADTVPHLQAY